MLSEYLDKQLQRAKYKILQDGSHFGEIPGIKGVWANTKNLETCKKELREVLEDWLFLKVRSGEKVVGITSRIDRREMVKSPKK